MSAAATCPDCGGPPVKQVGGESQTLIGFFSPPGHDHDDNRRDRVFICGLGHRFIMNRRNRCERCGWRGKDNLGYIDEWPDVPSEGALVVEELICIMAGEAGA